MLIYGAVAIVALLAAVAGVFWYMFTPWLDVYGGSISPDGRWVAVTEIAQYGPLAVGSADAAVEIRPFNHPLGYFQGKRVFMVDYGQNPNLLGVAWTGANALTIKIRSGAKDNAGLRLDEYSGIKITYEVSGAD